MHVRLDFSSKSALCIEISTFNYALSPIYMVSVPETTLPPRELYGAFLLTLTFADPCLARLLIWQNGRRQEKNSRKHPGHGVRAHFMFRVVSCRVGETRCWILKFGRCQTPDTSHLCWRCSLVHFAADCLLLNSIAWTFIHRETGIL